jgi:hypothetical protein
MPGIGSDPVCRQIPARPQAALLPALVRVRVLARLNDTASIGAACAAGASDFIAKPTHRTLLPRRVRHAQLASAAVGRALRTRPRPERTQQTAHLGQWKPCRPPSGSVPDRRGPGVRHGASGGGLRHAGRPCLPPGRRRPRAGAGRPVGCAQRRTAAEDGLRCAARGRRGRAMFRRRTSDVRRRVALPDAAGRRGWQTSPGTPPPAPRPSAASPGWRIPTARTVSRRRPPPGNGARRRRPVRPPPRHAPPNS